MMDQKSLVAIITKHSHWTSSIPKLKEQQPSLSLMPLFKT